MNTKVCATYLCSIDSKRYWQCLPCGKYYCLANSRRLYAFSTLHSPLYCLLTLDCMIPQVSAMTSINDVQYLHVCLINLHQLVSVSLLHFFQLLLHASKQPVHILALLLQHAYILIILLV